MLDFFVCDIFFWNSITFLCIAKGNFFAIVSHPIFRYRGKMKIIKHINSCFKFILHFHEQQKKKKENSFQFNLFLFLLFGFGCWNYLGLVFLFDFILWNSTEFIIWQRKLKSFYTNLVVVQIGQMKNSA